MNRWAHLWRGLTERPALFDAALALVLALPAMGIPVDAGGGEPVPQTLASRTLALLACALLAARRRWLVPVWASTVALATTSVWIMHGGSGAVLPSLVALSTLAMHVPPRQAVAAAAGEGLLLLLTRAIASPPPWGNPSTYGVAIWCLLAVVIGLAMHSQRRMVAAAQERARAAEESREEEAQRRVSEERLRIARDLHDVVAHHVAVITVQSGVAEHLLDSDPTRAREAIGHVRTASAEVLAEMGTLLGVLRAGEDAVSREPAHGMADVDSLIASARRTGLRVSLRREGAEPTLAPLVDLTAYRVLEEALTNAHRHGSDDSVDVRIATEAAGTLLEVRNRMDQSQAGGAGSGHGLIGMRERVASVGGSLSIGPDGQGWFVVRAQLPNALPPEPPAPDTVDAA